ncbi:MAG: TonB-dependent receptor, partial [Haliscomenobacter sp.]|nr:TonB-dependent receptor [Haliscomenobacter sp.]
MFEEKFKLVASIRYDHNYDFPGRWNPRLAAVYSPNEKWNYRISYQSGVRFPALFEALSYVNNGNVRRVGGLAKVNEGLGFLENSYTLNSLDLFAAAVNKDVAAGSTRNDAGIKNRNLLVVANLPQLEPEAVQAWDAGVKSIFLKTKWYWIGILLQQYTKAFGPGRSRRTIDGKVGTDAAVLNMLDRNKQIRYRVFTNATNTYFNYGSALRLSYNFYKKYSLSGNLNYNDLRPKTTTTSSSRVLIPRSGRATFNLATAK